MTDKQNKGLPDAMGNAKNYMPSSIHNQGRTAPGNAPVLDFEKLKDKLEDFKKKVIKKFNFVRAIGILPPASWKMFEDDETLAKEIIESKPIHAIVIIPEEHYKELAKIKSEIVAYAKESGENLWVHLKTSEVDLWNYGLDSKYEFIDAISASFPLYDNGFLGALRVANIHKSLVLNWLNVGRVHYVATYAIGGSLVRGTADKTSDVDTFVIIDDTDVKRMSRIELLEKLRGKIVGEFVREASVLAGVKNILNVQVYLLTDFWQSVKDAQPVMFTFIRDGVPLYDRGTFIPWKRLLQMGKIKPSPEAIDLYMKEGDRTEEIVKRRLLDSMVDVYYGVVTPTQAMMMLAGHAPPVPKTIVEEVKKVLVEEEKVMTMKELKTLEKVVKNFKDYEHGKLKEIPGKEIDELMQECKEYTDKMKELREKLEKKVQEHNAEKIYDEIFGLMKKILGDKGQQALLEDFEKEMIKKGKLSERMLKIARDVVKLKQKTKGKPLGASEMQKIIGDSSELLNALTEYSQRKEFITMRKNIIRLNAGENKAEVVVTSDGTFLVTNKGEIKKIDEAHMKIQNATKEELEKALGKISEKAEQKISDKAMKTLRNEFGDFEINF